ncbi:MAG: hypothetical protein ACLPMG_09140, partial [Terriglobales bacterium]
CHRSIAKPLLRRCEPIRLETARFLSSLPPLGVTQLQSDGADQGPFRIVGPDHERPARRIRQVTELRIVAVN